MDSGSDIDFWFSIGSTYSYLTVGRLDRVAAAAGIRFRWRPFSVRAIMREMDNVPFATKPIKSAYMWRDIERRAAMYGLPVRVPAPYPLRDFDLANQVAVLGAERGWGPAYVRATYRRWFVEAEEPGSEPNLSASLREIGLDAASVVAEAQTEAVGQAYLKATEAARRQGIFGVPSFVVRGELFWGDDRLEDAIRWHRQGTLAQP